MRLDPARALRIIEGLVMESCDDNELNGLIYMIAHQGNEHPCLDKHSNWKNIALETEQSLVEGRVIPPWEDRMSADFLARLRELSVDRCEKHFFPLQAWNLLEWAGAAAGEAGETANVAKKIRRAEILVAENKRIYDEAKVRERTEQLGDEVADTVIYLDLLCARAGIDLKEAIARKFNKVSKEHGYEHKL